MIIAPSRSEEGVNLGPAHPDGEERGVKVGFTEIKARNRQDMELDDILGLREESELTQISVLGH